MIAAGGEVTEASPVVLVEAVFIGERRQSSFRIGNTPMTTVRIPNTLGVSLGHLDQFDFTHPGLYPDSAAYKA